MVKTTNRVAPLMCILAATIAWATPALHGESVDGLIVVLVDEAAVVSVIEGSVLEIQVEEGQSVTADELVVKLDDRKMRLREQLAQEELRIAEKRIEQSHAIDSARSTVDTERLRVREQSIRLEMERRRAANELKVLAAEKAEAVAKNEWQRAGEARASFADAVSESEIEALRLAFQRSELETREARFQNQIAVLEVQLAELAIQTGQSQLEAAEIAVKQAESLQAIAKVEKSIKRIQRELAGAQSNDCLIRSPIEGQVVSIHVRPGEWVRPGDLVARVIGTRRLRVEGFAPSKWIDWIENTAKLTIVATGFDGQRIEVEGTRRFVQPEIDPVTNEVRFWVEFDNPGGHLRPGCRAKIEMDGP